MRILTARKYCLSVIDFLEGIYKAVGVGTLTYFQQTGNSFTWQGVKHAAIAAFLFYILEKFFTDDLKKARKIIKLNQIENKVDNEDKKQTQ